MTFSEYEVNLDVRGLQPPEPLERVMHALGMLEPDHQLLVVIDREPFPLYGLLIEKGFEFIGERIAPRHHEVHIWRRH